MGAEGRPVSATIVGDGPDRKAFEEQAKARGIAERVHFVGAMAARAAFARGRIMVVPSRAESLPYIVLEAAAAGLPLIATRVGGIPEIFGPQQGELVIPGDAAALARTIAAALSDPATRQAGSLRLREQVRAGFSAEAMTDAVLGAYAETLALRNG
jgi:glycosyltransferase involved in cell wall biosynthesis